MNPRPLGYEPYDVCLPCLASSLVATLTSADGQPVFMPGPLRLPRLIPSRRVSCTNPCTNQPSGQLVRVGQHDRLIRRATGRGAQIRRHLCRTHGAAPGTWVRGPRRERPGRTADLPFTALLAGAGLPPDMLLGPAGVIMGVTRLEWSRIRSRSLGRAGGPVVLCGRRLAVRAAGRLLRWPGRGAGGGL